MKNFLLRPRSVAGATLWGVLVAVLAFAAIVVADFLVAVYRGEVGSPHRLSAVALGNGYTIDFEATPAHQFLAEYTQELIVYRNDAREGGQHGRVAVPMNSGGRVRVLVYIPTDPDRATAALVDRYATSIIDLQALQVQSQAGDLSRAEWLPLGVISGESPPLKFIPCVVWGRLPPAEREEIFRPGEEALKVCNEHLPK